MSYLIRRVLAKPRLILDEICRLYGKFASYLRCVLCETRLIFPRINGPNVASIQNNVATMLQRCLVLKIVVANRTRVTPPLRSDEGDNNKSVKIAICFN